MTANSTSDDVESGEERLSPDDAFAALGDETRIDILRVLGQQGEPLSFSELYDRIEMRGSGQFNYHLEKLVGHFVCRTEAGYSLGRPGRRVVEAIFSGAVTDNPSLERAGVEESCGRCGGDVEVTWRDGSVELFCTECAGRYGRQHCSTGVADGYLGQLALPPAGLRNRSTDEITRAAWTWSNLEIMAMSSGLCPRCSAALDTQRLVCFEHDQSPELCSECNSRYQVRVQFTCGNCIYETGGAAVLALLSESSLLDFLTDHGYNPIDPEATFRLNERQMNYEEVVRSRDPFEAEFTFAAGDERLTLAVDGDLAVLGAKRER